MERLDIHLACWEKYPDLAPESWRKRNKKKISKDTAFIVEKQECVVTTEEADEVCLMADTEALGTDLKSDS